MARLMQQHEGASSANTDGEGARITRIRGLQATYRAQLLEKYQGEDVLFGHAAYSPPDALLLEASAIYHVTYKAARGRQAAAAAAAVVDATVAEPASPRGAEPAALGVPSTAMGAALLASRPPRAGDGGGPSQGLRTWEGTGLSFAWAVAGDFLEHIKCRASHAELCARSGEHTAPKMHLARSMQMLLSRR